MKGTWKHVGHSLNQGFGSLFVEEQAHGSSRDADGSALSLGRVGQARANVVVSELREVGQKCAL